MLENEYIGTSFAVGQVRTISGYQALRSAYEVSPNSNSKWENLLVLFLMAVGYRILVFILLQFRVRRSSSIVRFFRRKKNTNNARWMNVLSASLVDFLYFVNVGKENMEWCSESMVSGHVISVLACNLNTKGMFSGRIHFISSPFPHSIEND